MFFGYNQPDVGYPLIDVGYPRRCRLPSTMSVTQMSVTLADVGYPHVCRLPLVCRLPHGCRLPSAVWISIYDVGCPLCRLPSQMSVTPQMLVTPSDVGYPRRCRLPSQMSVTLLCVGYPLNVG